MRSVPGKDFEHFSIRNIKSKLSVVLVFLIRKFAPHAKTRSSGIVNCYAFLVSIPKNTTPIGLWGHEEACDRHRHLRTAPQARSTPDGHRRVENHRRPQHHAVQPQADAGESEDSGGDNVINQHRNDQSSRSVALCVIARQRGHGVQTFHGRRIVEQEATKEAEKVLSVVSACSC